MGSKLKVVIVDDDEIKRGGIGDRLDAMSDIDVIGTTDQDTAAAWPRDDWRDVDAVLVDIFDDSAVGEIGTDLYSGIGVVERTRDLPVRCIAVTPSCAHPLVQLRLHHAQPDFCYHRFQLLDLHALQEAVRYPDREHKLLPPDPGTIKSLGAKKLRANEAVRTFVSSPLHGKLDAFSSHASLDRQGVSRRTVDRWKLAIANHGFNHLDMLTKSEREGRHPDERPRWPDVRELVLRLIGRMETPSSEHDRPWWR